MKKGKGECPWSVWLVITICALLQFLLLFFGLFRLLLWVMHPERVPLLTGIFYPSLNIIVFALLVAVWKGERWVRLYFPFALATFTAASLSMTIVIRASHVYISFTLLAFLDSMGHGLSFIISIIGFRTRSAAKFFENTKRSD